MPTLRATRLENATARLQLAERAKPYWKIAAPGISIGYRRNKGPGTWTVRCLPVNGQPEWTKRIGIADDAEPADGHTVLNWHQAAELARQLARGGKPEGITTDAADTVATAVDAYEANLAKMGGDVGNAQRARFHLGALGARLVMQLGPRDLPGWQDGLIAKGLAPATVNRTRNAIRAALTQAAKRDPRIKNTQVWQDTALFERLPDATKARNVVLADADVHRFIAAAYQRDRRLGVFIETMAVTGARPSQLARLLVEDLHADAARPYLDMPRSAKGHKSERATKGAKRVKVLITPALAALLKDEAAARPAIAPLLTGNDGMSWEGDDRYRRHVRAIVEELGLTDTNGEVTLYALRHSNITRMLLRGVPVSVVANVHDTSVREIERHYAKHIVNHADDLVLAALLQLTPVADNVVRLAR
jgi:integrase